MFGNGQSAEHLPGTASLWPHRDTSSVGFLWSPCTKHTLTISQLLLQAKTPYHLSTCGDTEVFWSALRGRCAKHNLCRSIMINIRLPCSTIFYYVLLGYTVHRLDILYTSVHMLGMWRCLKSLCQSVLCEAVRSIHTPHLHRIVVWRFLR